MSHCFLNHSVRVVRVVRRGRDRHLHGQLLVPSKGAWASVAATFCRATVHQRYEKYVMLSHVVALDFSALKWSRHVRPCVIGDSDLIFAAHPLCSSGRSNGKPSSSVSTASSFGECITCGIPSYCSFTSKLAAYLYFTSKKSIWPKLHSLVISLLTYFAMRKVTTIMNASSRTSTSGYIKIKI